MKSITLSLVVAALSSAAMALPGEVKTNTSGENHYSYYGTKKIVASARTASIPAPTHWFPEERVQKNWVKHSKPARRWGKGSNQFSGVAAFQAPVFQRPQFTAPVFNPPVVQRPQFTNPTFQAPVFQPPQFQRPQFNNPVFQSPQFTRPNFQ